MWLLLPVMYFTLVNFLILPNICRTLSKSPCDVDKYRFFGKNRNLFGLWTNKYKHIKRYVNFDIKGVNVSWSEAGLEIKEDHQSN